MARLSMTFFDSVSFLFGGSKHDTVLSVLSEPLANVGGSAQSDRSPQTRLEVFNPPGCLAIGFQRGWDYPFLSLLLQRPITE